VSRRGYSYQPVLPKSLDEIRLEQIYRRGGMAAIKAAARRTPVMPEPVTRMGIAIAAGLRMREAHEQHAIGVARLLRLR